MALFYIGDETTASGSVNRGDIALLVAGGEIDFSAGPVLRERLLATIQHGRHHLVVDLSEVTFIDSTAIGALVGAATSVHADGVGSVRVVCVPGNDRVMRIFDIAGVASLIELHTSRAQALAAIDATQTVEVRDASRHSVERNLGRQPGVGPATAGPAPSREPVKSYAINNLRIDSASVTDRRHMIDEVA